MHTAQDCTSDRGSPAELEYRDEFHIGMTDSSGTYHSWPVSAISFQVQDPLEKHVDAMSHYTDKDMHDVLAYIETMK